MTKHDLYWLAGLLEGEGHFGAYGYGQRPQARISFVSTDKDIVERACQFLEAKSVRRNRSRNRLGRKKQYITAVYSSRARKMMRRLIPLMGLRRQRQIHKALLNIQSPAWNHLEP